MNRKLIRLTRAAVIASLYIVLTLLSNMLGLASGAIQIRFSEALCLLPILFAESIWGLFIGCLISNILTGCIIWDIIFGSLATLAGAILTRVFRKNLYLASFAPVVTNTAIVPLVIKYAYATGDAWWLLFAMVFATEFITCCILAPRVVYRIQNCLKS